MTEDDSPPIIEFKPTGAIVCPGLSFDEWQDEWTKIDRTSRSINWLVGDVLVAGEEQHPDKWTQVLDPKFAEQQRGVMRVALRIPLANRRDPDVISWSAHREAAAAETLEERLELLDLAEANGWGSREVAAELRRRREARQHNGPPPDGVDEASRRILEETTETLGPALTSLAGSTWNEDYTCGTPGVIDGRPVLVALGSAATADAGTLSLHEMRLTIERVREIAPSLALGESPEVKSDLSWQIVRAAGRDRHQEVLDSVELAISLVPNDWRVHNISSGIYSFFGRKWSVELQRGDIRRAFGGGPHLASAICEAVLAIFISETENAEKTPGCIQ